MMSLFNQVLDLKWEDFSVESVERAKWVVIDTLLVMFAGLRSSPESQSYLQNKGVSAKSDKYAIRVPGTHVFVTSEDAAILFGASIVCNEMDEGSQFAKGHPAAHLIPVLYIESMQRPVSGKAFISALIKSYEIAARFGYASKMNDDMHPHGTWGIIGGTIASGLLWNKSKDQLIRSILLAASLPLATSWEAAVTGQTVRNLYTGLGNWIALNIRNFEQAGFVSSEHVVRHLWGEIMSEGVDESLFLKDFKNPFLIEKNYFKLYPACRFSHSAIEAFSHLVKKRMVIPEDIESIDVDTYSLSTRLREPQPHTMLEAKFSIPFLIAVLAYGFTLFDVNKQEVFHNHSIRRLSRNIHVHINNQMSLMLPEKRPARVTIHLKNGETLQGTIDDAPDGFEQNSRYRLEEKHQKLLRQWPDQVAVNDWIKKFRDFEKVNNIRKILEI